MKIRSRLAETLVQVSDEQPIIVPPEDDQREIPKLMGRALAKSVESLLGEDAMEAPIRVATNPEWKQDAWLIDDQVYLARQGGGFDTMGKPMGARWECSFTHWKHYFNAVHAKQGWQQVRS